MAGYATIEEQREVVERDGFQCMHPGCSHPGPFHVGHIEPYSEGGENFAENSGIQYYSAGADPGSA